MARPRMYKTPEEFTAAADAYFAECKAATEPATITGLALGLGFSGRQALENYAERPEFVDAVKRARARVEAGYESRLWSNAPTGAIFALKNMGWADKVETAHSGEIGIRKIERVIRNAAD